MSDAGAVARRAEPVSHRPVARRSVLVGAALGVIGGAVPLARAAAAPVYTPVPKLPGEVARTDTRITRLGKKPYECIDVVVQGDRAKLYVPHATPPSKRVASAAVWFYHSNGSTNTSLDGAYKYGAEMVVDAGGLCICPDFGGPSTWSNQTAIAFQQVWSSYLTSQWKIATSFARANSGGGALMIWAYANRMLPYQRGMYLANATYDVEELYSRDPTRIGPPYGNDPAVIAATNPSRLPQPVWAGTRLKTVVSLVDPVVPPTPHGLALAGLAQPVATDVRIQYHDEGHVVPSWTQQDMVAVFKSWM